MSPFLYASLSFFFPVGLIRSPTMTGPLISTTSSGVQTAAGSSLHGDAGISPPAALRSALMKDGSVPQQPPMNLTPRAGKPVESAAKDLPSSPYSPDSGSGSPALGFAIKGRSVQRDSSSIIGRTSAGPSEQFTPMAETPSPWSIRAIDATVVPVKVRISFSKVIVHITGRSVFSTAARTAALSSRTSMKVSRQMRSAPASSPAVTCFLKASYASSNVTFPLGSTRTPRGPISSAASIFLSAQASADALAFATAALISSSTVYSVPASLYSLTPKLQERMMSDPASI